MSNRFNFLRRVWETPWESYFRLDWLICWASGDGGVICVEPLGGGGFTLSGCSFDAGGLVSVENIWVPDRRKRFYWLVSSDLRSIGEVLNRLDRRCLRILPPEINDPEQYGMRAVGSSRQRVIEQGHKIILDTPKLRHLHNTVTRLRTRRGGNAPCDTRRLDDLANISPSAVQQLQTTGSNVSRHDLRRVFDTLGLSLRRDSFR